MLFRSKAASAALVAAIPVIGQFVAVAQFFDIIFKFSKPKRKMPKQSQSAASTSKLPTCMAAFLKRYYPHSQIDLVRLHNSSPFDLTGNSVTFGHDIYLASKDAFLNPANKDNVRHIMHEFDHTRQYEAGATPVDFVLGYIKSGSHDGSLLESQAEEAAKILQATFLKSPEYRQCSR